MADQDRAPAVRLTHHLGKFWTAANVLSLSRIVLAMPATYLVLAGHRLFDGADGTWLFVVLMLIILTDWFDGQVARWSGTVSEWGKVLDPVADKFAGTAVLVALVLRPQEVAPRLPFWFLFFVLGRDTLILLGGLLITRRTGTVLMSVRWGKVAVAALALTVLAALMELDPDLFRILLWTTTALLTYAFVLYAIRFARIWRAGRTPAAPPGGSPPKNESRTPDVLVDGSL